MKKMQRQDSLGRWVTVPVEPKRIVSLCPSQTETLFALGLEGRLVGRTRYCIHPAEKVATLSVVGGTKKVDPSLIQSLRPDLIIAEKEENTREDVECLAEIAPVYVTKNESWEEALDTIHRLGIVTGTLDRAGRLIEEIEATWATVPWALRLMRVLYLVWRKPYMAAGSLTFIDAVMRRLGWENVAATLSGRYPIIEDPSQLRPEIVLLCSEPYPYKAQHVPEVQALWPEARVEVVRGDYFAWYGARLIEAARYMRELQRGLG
jgi:ABC-type Fe3+-hydroxamate transport system substrate-binding protein